MQETLKTLLCDYEFYKDSDITKIQKINEEAYYFYVDHNKIYLVCTQDGADEILNEYRESSVLAAKCDIPKVYQDFFDFTAFSEYSWQSLYDVYETVNDFVYNDKQYYICLI